MSLLRKLVNEVSVGQFVEHAPRNSEKLLENDSNLNDKLIQSPIIEKV